MRKLCLFIVPLILILSACLPTGPTPTAANVDSIVAQTMAAYTVAAMLTEAAPSDTPNLIASDTPGLTPSDTPAPPTNTPAENAPDPLPVAYTGVILNNGECVNFDNGQIVASPDAQCDVWLAESTLFRQVNGSQLSGYVTLEPPTRTHCVEGRYEPGDLAVQTDMYMCFITNEAEVGFIVVREYRGQPITGIVFDYWVFR